jgi:hypothetical protein
MKIIGELFQAVGEVGVGNLRQAKCGHAMILPLRSYIPLTWPWSRNDDDLRRLAALLASNNV